MKRKITTMLMAVMMIVALTPFMAHAYEYPWGDGSGAEIMEFIYFFDADGSLLHIQRTAHGQIPVYNGETPTKPSDANYTYTFAGWDPELKPAEGPMSYAATYTRTEKKDPVFSVSANSITYGEDATISATLPNDATGSFQVTVVEDSTGNERKEAAEVKNGGAEVVVHNLLAGEYTVTAVYSGDEQYKQKTGGTTFTVSPVLVTEWTDEHSLPNSPGNYKLTKNVNLGSSCWQVPVGKTSLNLNGKSIITSNDDGAAIVLRAEENQNCTLNVFDDNTTGESVGTITNTREDGVRLETGPTTFNMYGGRIADCDDYGVQIKKPEAVFNMYGGEISGCWTGVSLSNSAGAGFNMYNGKISSSTSTGVKMYENTEFTLYNGEISGSQLGVDASEGTFRMENGLITNNKQGVKTASATTGIILQGNNIIPKIEGNKGDDNKNNNLYIDRTNGLKLRVKEGTTISGEARIGITTEGTDDFTDGLYGTIPWQSDIFFSDNPDYYVCYISDGEAYLDSSLEKLVGCVDVVDDCHDGSIVVHGWVFDMAYQQYPVGVYVYIGGEAGSSGAEAHDEIKANSQRSDVDNVHHCGDHHGFTAVIPTDKRGEQTVYIYAKYIGSGKTELIGSKTVTITGPTPALTQDPTKVAVPGGRTLIYNSKAQTGVASGKGYTLSGTKSATKAGSYQAKATLKEGYVWKDGTTAAKTIKWKINKAANTLRIKARTANVKYSAVKKKNQVLGVTKVLTITNKGQGAKTYIKKSGNAKITIAKTTGKVTVKKGLKKGTYKVKVKVKAAGNANYKASAWKTVTFKIKVTAK